MKYDLFWVHQKNFYLIEFVLMNRMLNTGFYKEFACIQ